jgi:hypothetical protein
LWESRSAFLSSPTLSSLGDHDFPVLLHVDDDPAVLRRRVEGLVELADVSLAVATNSRIACLDGPSFQDGSASAAVWTDATGEAQAARKEADPVMRIRGQFPISKRDEP